MLNKAIEKIKEEIKEAMKNSKNYGYVRYVGEYILQNLNESNSENILKEGKTIIGSLKHMENVAKKQKIGNVAVLTPEEGLEAVMEYYEIKDLNKDGENKKIEINIEDLF
jgi:hypothetical protein